jgi:hypothetical protein
MWKIQYFGKKPKLDLSINRIMLSGVPSGTHNFVLNKKEI